MKNNSIPLMRRLPVLILSMSLIISGCVALPWHPKCVEFPNADGAGLPDEEIGYLSWRIGIADGVFSIDYEQVSPKGMWEKGEWIPLYGIGKDEVACFAKLKPGSHIININGIYSSNRPVVASLIINIEAGHHYKIYTDGCYSCIKNWRSTVWVVDEDTGEVIAGKLPDWWLP